MKEDLVVDAKGESVSEETGGALFSRREEPWTLGRPRRWTVLLVFALAVPWILFGSKSAYDGTANRVEDWLPTHFEETRKLLWFVSHFGSDEILMVGWPGCTLEDPRVGRLATELVHPAPGSREPWFRFVFTGPGALDALTGEPLELSRAEALGRLQGWLVGPDRHATCLVALVSPEGMNDRRAAIAWVYERAAALGLAAEDLHVAGPTIDGVAIDQTSGRGMLLLTGLSLLACLVLTCFFLRSVRLALLVLAAAVFCQQSSLALVFYTGGRMDIVLMMIAPLVLVLATSTAVHLVNYYQDVLRENGPNGAPLAAVGRAALPCGLAAGTTALGLGSLAISHIVPIAKFGVYASVAVLGATGIVFVFLAAGLEQWPVKKGTKRRKRVRGSGFGVQAPEAASMAKRPDLETGPLPSCPDEGLSAKGWRWLLGGVFRFHGVIVVAALAVLVVAGMAVTENRTSTRLHDLFPDDAPVLRDYDWLEAQIGPLIPVEIVLRFHGVEPEAVMERMLLVERVRDGVEQVAHVGSTISAATFAPTLPGDTGILNSTAKRIVLKRKLQRHRAELLATRFIHETDDEELWRISARVPAGAEADYGLILDELERRVTPLLEAGSGGGGPGARAEFCGGMPLIQKAQNQLLEDLIESFLLAFGLIGVTMVFLLRSVVAGALSMIPNVLPAALVFGTMGWTGIPVEIGAVMTASAALGIAVDDTLHFITWFRRGLGRGQTREQAVRFAYSRCGRAMLQTSLICGLGLLLFALSGFIPVRRFALMMFALLTLALVGDLVVLPALLVGPLGRVFRPGASPGSYGVAEK